MKSTGYESGVEKHPAIGTIINFCTIDHKFLDACLREAGLFSRNIIVPVCNHLYNGDRENMSLLRRIIQKHSSARISFLVFDYDHTKTIMFGSRFWHNYARWTGVMHLGGDIQYVLFLDGDEILDGKRFMKWMDASLFFRYDAISFNSYWYFREPGYQATTTEQAGMLVKKDSIRNDLLFSEYERLGFLTLPHVLYRQNGPDGSPMVHHYSWVRSKEEMIRKVRSWGHNKDRDWLSLVEQEFQHDFNGTDFVHGYQYRIVDSAFNFGYTPDEAEKDSMLPCGDVGGQGRNDNCPPLPREPGTLHEGNMNDLTCQAEAAATLLRLGDISAGEHCFERARELYTKALSIAPWNAEAKSRLDNLK
ncbi:MAG: hypothetical protein ABSF52_18550 [Syntrophobacteraceae bacterium]|jgi:hypothetical protein